MRTPGERKLRGRTYPTHAIIGTIPAQPDARRHLPGDEPGTYGLHLTLRAGDIEDREALEDAEVIDQFLVSLVAAIGMTVLAGPLIGTAFGPPEQAGVSGVVILVESHAAVHTYPAVGELFLDVFSCRPFAVGAVATVMTAFFGAHRLKETTLADRGHHWDADVSRELERWRTARCEQPYGP